MKNVNQTGNVNNDVMDRLVAFITTTTYASLPAEIITLAKQAMIDTLGVSIAGWREDAVQKTIAVYGEQAGNASLFAQAKKTSEENAALINGTATHVLDYDDASAGVIIHPSAPILAAITPVAERLQSSGQDVITAYAIGTEVMIRIGEIMGVQHYRLGWHATDTLGTIGAAAACAYLEHLNDEQCAHAIAIAASMSGGLQKNFGSMTKPLHVGLAASHGIQAVKLAHAGFTGNTNIFKDRGFFLAYGGMTEQDVIAKQATLQFGSPYDLLTSLAVKKFPCCFATHRFIHGMQLLKTQHNLTLDDIEAIVLHAQSRSLLPLVHHRPKTGLQGKFSAQYTVLAALVDEQVTLTSFTDEQVQRPHLQQSFEKVSVHVLEEPETPVEGLLPVTLHIHARGEVYELSVPIAPGSVELPLSADEHREKWVSCLHYYAPDVPASQFSQRYDDGMALETIARFSDWLQAVHDAVELPLLKH